jgi:hypothetical protein
MQFSRHSEHRNSTADRPRTGGGIRRFGVIGLIALLLTLAGQFAAENASAATYSTAGGGSCSYSGNSVTIRSGNTQFSAQTTTLVKRWVRLVDVKGYAQTGWTYVGYKWASPGYPASFGRVAISRTGLNIRSGIQSEFAFYVNGTLRNILFETTTWYSTSVYLNGLGYSPGPSSSSC